MKSICKVLATLLTIVLVFTLTGCGSKNYDDYIGYQFAGKNPWGGELAITLRTLEDSKLTYTFTMDLGSGESSTLVYAEPEGILKDDSLSFIIMGKDNDHENYEYDYSGTLTLKDGKVVVELEKGQVTVKSTEGGSTAYNVGALEDEQKTITLEKVVDNS